MIDLGSWAETLGLRRKKTFVERMQDAAGDVVDTLVDSVHLPDVKMPKMRMPDVSVPDVKLPSVRMPDVHLPEMRMPRVPVGEYAGEAADKVRYGAAATGAAAAGVASGIGGFFGAIFSALWWLVTFAVKTAVLAGVAYAGWQWLQSRRTQDNWGRDSGGSSAGSTSGSGVSSSTYGTVSASEPAEAGVGSR
ncbi:MAG TPA: hypothetical protein VFX49_09275 [Chloroflexota bacterium]|nr:hypothetical protein [Chloroflexota bacterium]